MRLQTRYEAWVVEPTRTLDGELIEHRCDYISEFVTAGIEPFLKRHQYTLGRNIKRFKNKLSMFWFFMTEAVRRGKYLQYEKPTHRNHKYDSAKFFDVFDNEIFPEFLDDWMIEGFLDDSEVGTKIAAEIKYFIYTWIDLDSSPAREEVDEILREEDERKRISERIKKEGYGFLQNKNYDYDAADLGTFRGDRVYT